MNASTSFTRLRQNLEDYDAEVNAEISTGGERADLWSEIDVNVEDLRTVLAENETFRTAFDGIEPAAQEPVADNLETQLQVGRIIAQRDLQPTRVVNRAQRMVRSMDQWRNMVPKAVAEGSQAQVEYALHDAKHDIEAMWCALTSALASPTDADAAVVTEAQMKRAVYNAALAWCGEKDRETFPEDIEYFKCNWDALPGLRRYVERELGRAALTAAKAGEDGR